MSDNVMLGFPNRIDSATLSGGAWQAALPLANLKTRPLAQVARSVDSALASTKFDVDLGAEKNIRLLSAVNHNLSLNAKARDRLSTVADFSTTIYDSGWVDVWPVVFGAYDLEWEEDNWFSGKYSEEQRAGYTWKHTHILPGNKVARYWRREYDDTGNSAGYVQLGRLFVGPAWQPTVNMLYGTGLGWETDTEVQQAESGAEYFNRRTPRRVQQFVLDAMSENEAFAQAFEIQRRAGIDLEVLYIFNPADTVHALRRQFLARLRKLSPVEFPTYGTHRAAFEVGELLP